MSNGGKRRTRLDRVAALELPPGKLLTALRQLRSRDALVRMGLCFLAAAALWGVNGAWEPPFGYRNGDVPARDILAAVTFKEPNPTATEDARQKARAEARFVYVQDPEPIVQLRAQLRNAVFQVKSAATFANLDRAIWKQFESPLADGTAPMTTEAEEEEFEHFRAALAGDGELVKFQQAVAAALSPFERRGLLEKLPPEHDKGNQKEILVHPAKDAKDLELVQVEDVLIGAISGEGGPLETRLVTNLQSKDLANRIFNWLRSRLSGTLKLDLDGTEANREEVARNVPEEFTVYQAGQILAKAGQTLGDKEMRLLTMEHAARLAGISRGSLVARSAAVLLLILVLCVPCGVCLYRRDKQLLFSLQRFCTLLVLATLTSGLARWLAGDAWRAEIIPLLLFGLTIAIAYSRELAIMLTGALALLLAVCTGHGLGNLIVVFGVVTAAVLMLSSIRSRGKLIQIGVLSGLVAFALTLIVGLLEQGPFDWLIVWELLVEAGRTALWTVLVGFLITGLLPFIEKLFGVLTDISLLELGDAAHPLLQELVRRAPGTYNHSINVASLAEPAAESIGARGLLVRVGAYFHDIGKMLKPGYFVENQGLEANRHDTLMPAMSTLIIIAHIKDGADLARQHHVPQAIIDFIEQHHGTTLVEYFYRLANEQSEQNPDASEVEESAFRYPGPKPQTREAAVLMLSDAVESASRVLVEPTPSRIENLVEEIAMKRLLDGQFDECDLTLQEVRTIEDSLVKSLIAVYHGRIKYPDQRTA